MDNRSCSRWPPSSGLQIRYWHVMDSGHDSVELLRRLFDRYEQRLSYVVVLNQLRGDSFDILNTSGQLERARALNATVIPLKRLRDAAMTRIESNSSSFWAATQPEERGGVSLGDPRAAARQDVVEERL